MPWRTAPCAAGAGCSDEQPVPLCVVQGAPIEAVYAVGSDVTGRGVRAEIRTAPGGRLLLDMAPYCTADTVDPALLRVNVPGAATAHLTSSGYYDIWVDADRITYGSVLLELAVSINPPRTIIGNAWAPILTLGQGFERTIDTTGMMPEGEDILTRFGYQPAFTVRDMGGEIRLHREGEPALTLLDRVRIALRLTAAEVNHIGVGRHTYLLRVANLRREPRNLLAGVLEVEEGGIAWPDQ